MPINEQQAKENLQALIKKYNALSVDDRKTMSEATVVRQFIDILLRDVLGWPIEDPARYRYEQVTQVGRPDMMLTPEKGGTIFVEAKRFGIIKELEEARKTVRGIVTPGQLSLPGMAVDRTAEEQQAINYAFANNGTWAILSNFERLRLFNARRDWLVLSFETPGTYLTEFDFLWQLAYHNVLAGSLDALSNQRLTAEIDTDYLRFINEWREKLAQDIVQHPERNTWAVTSDGELDLPRLRAVVQRIIDRLVILRFAEDHLVLPAGSLRGVYDVRQQSYLVDVDQMVNTMFRRFDKIHNSALFAEGLADKASFSEDVLLGLITKLYEARYRSMPADIMGNTYEQYLGKTLVRQNGSIRTADNLETRKKQGSYYTPQVIVRYIVDNSLGRYLYGTENGKQDGKPIPGESRRTSTDIRDLHVLDSACGSGSFLIYAYEVLNNFYETEKGRLQSEFEQRVTELSAQQMKPTDIRIELSPIQAELDRLNNHPRLILETHLYGVDLDPQAAEIAVVNLMMRGMERKQAEKRLPLILNQNVKVGNGLIGLRPDDARLIEHAQQIAAIRQLRADLIRFPNDGPDHERIIRELEAGTASLTAALDEPLVAEFDDLNTIRPFHWAVEFPEVFYGADGNLLPNPGFTVVIGNPPWEILKPDLREFYAQFDAGIESKLNRQQVEARIEQLQAEDPRRKEAFDLSVKTVEQTAAYVRQFGDYTRQGRGDVATHKLFLERMYGLLRNEGRLGYVVPSGIYTDLGTKELREMLLNEGNIQYIFSFSNERFFFPGVDHRFKFALLGAQKGPQSDGFWSVFRFNPRVAIAPNDLPDFVGNAGNLIYVRRESLAKFSPDTLSVMEFQTRRDYEIAEKIYGNWPLLGDAPHPSSPSPFTQRGDNKDGEMATEVGSAVDERWFSTSQLWEKLKPLARQMRTDPTPAEDALWQQLRNRQVANLKFRRQHSIERFMVDFYCADLRMIIEVDGPIHDYNQEEDAIRQEFLEAQGFRVLRFTNDEVLQNLPSVLERITAIASSPVIKNLTLNPSPFTERDLKTGIDSPSPSTERGLGGEVLSWSIRLNRQFDMANDRALLNSHRQGVPLYEGKMIHQYDAFYEAPQFWISSEQLAQLSQTIQDEIKSHRVVHRRIASATNERTLISAIAPRDSACDTNATTALIDGNSSEKIKLYVCALFNSFALDTIIRYKVSTTLNMFYLQQLPLPRLTPGNPHFDAIVPRAAQLTCTRPEFAALWQEVMGSAWDESKGATDPAIRQRLRDEIDAIVAHLYGLSRDDFDHILGTFPLVFPDTDSGRAKRSALLSEYDAWSGKLNLIS